MPVRNLWSLEPGECIVAEEILEKLKGVGVEVIFPLRDVGIDLLVVRGGKHVGLHVKESHYFIRRRWKSGHIGHSWHQIKKEKFLKGKDRIDFYAFVTYLQAEAEHKMGKSEQKFLIVPSSELEKRMAIKSPGSKKIFSFCLHFEDGKAWWA